MEFHRPTCWRIDEPALKRFTSIPPQPESSLTATVENMSEETRKPWLGMEVTAGQHGTVEEAVRLLPKTANDRIGWWRLSLGNWAGEGEEGEEGGVVGMNDPVFDRKKLNKKNLKI